MQGKLRELEEMARLQKESLDADKQRIENELQQKEAMLRQEAEEKNSLEQVIKMMELKLVSGGQALEDQEKEKARAYRDYQQKLKAQKKKEKQLLEEKLRKEEEMLSVTRQYKDLQEEAVENRKVIEVLKNKLKVAQQETKDLKEEQQGDRDEMLETIRQQSYDLKFYRKLVRMLMKDEEIAKMKMKSEWDEDADDWIVPPFMLKAKEVTLPSLIGGKKAYDVMEQEKENRELAVEGDDDGSDDDGGGQQQQKRGGLFAGKAAANGNNVRASQQKASNGFDYMGGGGGMQGGRRGAAASGQSDIGSSSQQKRVQSRGRAGQMMPPARPGAGVSGGMMPTSSQNHIITSPDPPILAKNNKAMAQLAPLDYNPTTNTSILNGTGSSANRGINIPSLEQLQH